MEETREYAALDILMDDDIKQFLEANHHLCLVFLGEIQEQHAQAMDHLSEMNKQLSRPRTDMQSFWMAMYGLVTSVAHIGLILKPAKQQRRRGENDEEFIRRSSLTEKRGRALRQLISLDDDHGVLNRNLRNRFVHVDEDIDDWWLISDRHNIARRNIGPIGQMFNGLEENEIFEQYDQNTKILYYRGQSYNIQNLVSDVNDVIKKMRDSEGELRKNNIELRWI